jgi:hypothetical protein
MNIKELNERLNYGLMSLSEAQTILDMINMGSDTMYYLIVNEQVIKG